MFDAKIFLAELIGTFALVFIGAGSAVMGAGLVGIALAHALAIAVFAYAYGHISGTHINPAVTFALALNGRVGWDRAFGSYWIPQLSGAALGALVLRTVAGDVSAGATVGSLTLTYPGWAMAVEAILTFFLVNTVLHAIVEGKAGQLGGLAAGLSVGMSILVGGPLTGASLNPARTFGPALFSAPDLQNPLTYMIYLLGPMIGAALAVMVYRFFITTTPDGQSQPRRKSSARKSAQRG